MSADLSQRWLDKANEDLAVAHLVRDEEFFSHACFLAQQCIEKSPKAYLFLKTHNPPRTHRLVDLVNECAAFEKIVIQFVPDCTVVDQYYIPTRYPDAVAGAGPDFMVSQTEADEAIQIAEKIYQFIEKQLAA